MSRTEQLVADVIAAGGRLTLPDETARRGYKVACIRVREDSYGRSEWKPAKDGQLIFTINRHELKVRIWEKGSGEKGSGLRGPYEHQKKRWQRVRAWQEADAIRAYRDAVEARHGNDAIAADPEAAQWLALARERADRAQQLPRLPADPEITHEALKPYRGGWSPYGPRRW